MLRSPERKGFRRRVDSTVVNNLIAMAGCSNRTMFLLMLLTADSSKQIDYFIDFGMATCSVKGVLFVAFDMLYIDSS